MKKHLLMASLAVCSTVLAGTAFAQDGSFKDVPNDHWSYAAIEKLTSLNPKVFIGDPDGQFRGKRNLTRYEMAVIIARLLENIDATYAKKGDVRGGGESTPVDLSGYAKKSDLGGLSSKSDVEALRKLTGEFQNELNTLGVDVDGIKKRLDGLDGRVKKIEDTLAKLPKISGNFDVYARANGRGAGTTGISSLLDRDGYLVSGARKTVLNDARALHDFNLDITATPDEKTTLGVRLNYGNYLSYVTNAAGNRGAGANLTQQSTIWKATIDTNTNLPLLGDTKLSIGRVPTQFTPYTFKLVDPDTYIANENTDSGNIPVDGVVANAKVGGIGIKAVVAKVDPINLVSNVPTRAFTVGATAMGGSTTGPVGLPFNAGRTGSASIEQVAGAHLTLPTVLGFDLTATGLAFGTPLPGSQGYVYGAGLSRKIAGFGVNAAYTRSENANGASRSKNEATDATASRSFGSVNLTGGYRKIDPNFNAPGAWERLGTYQNPTAIKGYYGKASLPVGKLAVSGEFHQYDYQVSNEITNVRGNVAVGLGGTSSLELGAEQNKFKTGNIKQNFVNVGYSTMLSSATSFKLGYQLLDYKNQAPTLAAKGNVITGQFSVKF